MKFITQSRRYGEGLPHPNFFYKRFILFLFLLLFPRRCTIISDLDFDYERVLKLQQLHQFNLEPRSLLLQKGAMCPKEIHSFTIFKFFSQTLKITVLMNFWMTFKQYKSIHIRYFKTFKFWPFSMISVL